MIFLGEIIICSLYLTYLIPIATQLGESIVDQAGVPAPAQAVGSATVSATTVAIRALFAFCITISKMPTVQHVFRSLISQQRPNLSTI